MAAKLADPCMMKSPHAGALKRLGTPSASLTGFLCAIKTHLPEEWQSFVRGEHVAWWEG